MNQLNYNHTFFIFDLPHHDLLYMIVMIRYIKKSLTSQYSQWERVPDHKTWSSKTTWSISQTVISTRIPMPSEYLITMWPLDLEVSACTVCLPKFSVHSSIRFPFREETDRETNTQSQKQMITQPPTQPPKISSSLFQNKKIPVLAALCTCKL